MDTIYQLRIELAGSEPFVWRTLTVPANTPFDQLHDIFMITMGWDDEPSYEFIVGDTRVHDFGPEIDSAENPLDRDVIDTFLGELVSMIKATFTYKLEDRWIHKVTLENVLNSDDEIPACIDGEGVCPPANVHGSPGSAKVIPLRPDLEYNKSDGSELKSEGVPRFNKHKVNARLRRYHEEWEEIYADETINEMEGVEGNPWLKMFGRYEDLKKLKSHQDLLNNYFAKQRIEDWFGYAIVDKTSLEAKTFERLNERGFQADESRAMIQEVYALERYFDLKYGIDILDDRYEGNLHRLPEKPIAIPALQTACDVLEMSTKGVPFEAIEFLHGDKSDEARNAIVNAFKGVSDSPYVAEEPAGIWYACAAEGHICEELIDPLIGIYTSEDQYHSDWLLSQGQYLIGKLAQKYPEKTVLKVLEVMEQEARDSKDRPVYFLFDAFYFCDITPYKERLLNLIKHPELSYYTSLADLLAGLDIKEALSMLREQVNVLKAGRPAKKSAINGVIGDLEEAIEQLETGVNLYPDVDEPLCLTRGTWREEYTDSEEFFYEDDNDFSAEDDYDSPDEDYSDFPSEYDWSPQQPIINENKTGRNDPCPCGSGKKYKKCCLDKET